MKEERAADSVVEHVDADAVCERCGTVNAEDTFLCRSCGNNLRDQRARRIASEQAAEAALPRERRRWLSKLLALLGILVVLWVALNVGDIESYLIAAQRPDSAQAYWTGPESPRYEEMVRILGTYRQPTSADIAAAKGSSPEADNYGGRYVLLPMQERFGGSTVIGEAYVEQQDLKLFFVAKLYRDSTEIRGTAQVEDEGRVAARNPAGIKIGRDYHTGDGVALRREDGGLDCYGRTDFGGAQFAAIAYRLP